MPFRPRMRLVYYLQVDRKIARSSRQPIGIEIVKKACNIVHPVVRSYNDIKSKDDQVNKASHHHRRESTAHFRQHPALFTQSPL